VTNLTLLQASTKLGDWWSRDFLLASVEVVSCSVAVVFLRDTTTSTSP